MTPDEPCQPLAAVRWHPDVPLVEPAWRTDAALRLAGRHRATNDPAILPVLADALEEAGCDNQYLLAHLRAGGPHRPDCWAVTAVLESRPPRAEVPSPEPLAEVFERKRVVAAETAERRHRARRDDRYSTRRDISCFAGCFLTPFVIFAVIYLADWIYRLARQP